MTPAQFNATREPWGFFVTLTFAGKVPPPALAYALQCRWLDRAADLLLVNRASLGWLSREEYGETNGRLHLHVLLGQPDDTKRLNTRTCLALMGEWEKVTAKKLGKAGMARCRVFVPTMQGVEYVLKGLDGVTDWSLRGANSYEVGKFNGLDNQTVRLARSLLVRWGSRKGHKYALHARDGREAHRVKFGQF